MTVYSHPSPKSFCHAILEEFTTGLREKDGSFDKIVLVYPKPSKALWDGGALAAFMYFGIDQRAATGLKFMPWIGMPEYMTAVLAIAILGPVLTLLPTLVLTRKYLKV